MPEKLFRRLSRRRWTASAAAAALALGGGLVALAPSAGAATVTPTMHCTTPAGDATGPQPIAVTLDPDRGDGDTQMTIDPGPSPATSPFPIPLVTIRATYTFSLSGGATGDLSVDAPAFDTEVKPNVPMEGPTFTVPAKIVGAAANSTVDLTVKSIVVDTYVEGNLLGQATCLPVENNGVAASYVVEQASEAPTLEVSPTEVGSNSRVTLAGENWPSGPVSLNLCFPEFGGFCSNTREMIADSDVRVSGGTLSGWVHIAGTVPSTTVRLEVTAGSTTMSKDLTVTSVPVGDRKVTLTPEAGPVGTTVIVNGTGFTPYSQVTLQARDEPGAPLGFGTTITAGADGAFSGALLVDDPATTSIWAFEYGNAEIGVRTPFTFKDGVVPLAQTVSGEIKPGQLTMTQAGDTINLGTATLTGEPLELTGSLNQVTVVDARGTNLGWSLTGAMSDLTTAEGKSIPAASVSWVPACVATPGSPATVTAGSAGPLGSTSATLCTQEPGKDVTGGGATADAELTLKTPAFVPVGSYSATLTLSLS